jgi:hypothetical protein
VTAVVAVGATMGAAGCGTDEPDQPAAGPTATAPAEGSGPVGPRFPDVKSLVERTSTGTFTAEYSLTAGDQPAPETLVVVRQDVVTALRVGSIRWLWTPDDTYMCVTKRGAEQCLRRGAPSRPRDGDWAAVLAEAGGFEQLSPIAAWQYLERQTSDATQVTETSRTVAGQDSVCVQLTNESQMPDVDWTGTVTQCFLTDAGVLAQQQIELSSGAQATGFTFDLVAYAPTADATALSVPAQATVNPQLGLE